MNRPRSRIRTPVPNSCRIGLGAHSAPPSAAEYRRRSTSSSADRQRLGSASPAGPARCATVCARNPGRRQRASRPALLPAPLVLAAARSCLTSHRRALRRNKKVKPSIVASCSGPSRENVAPFPCVSTSEPVYARRPVAIRRPLRSPCDSTATRKPRSEKVENGRHPAQKPGT